MLAHMKTHHTDAANVEIMLTVPKNEAANVARIIESILKLAGHTVRHIDDENEEMLSIEEVFPEANPAMVLRGLRGKEDITQEELAKRLDITQNMVSEMENNKRPISLKMAKCIGKEFNISYKVFL